MNRDEVARRREEKKGLIEINSTLASDEAWLREKGSRATGPDFPLENAIEGKEQVSIRRVHALEGKEGIRSPHPLGERERKTPSTSKEALLGARIKRTATWQWLMEKKKKKEKIGRQLVSCSRKPTVVGILWRTFAEKEKMVGLYSLHQKTWISSLMCPAPREEKEIPRPLSVVAKTSKENRKRRAERASFRRGALGEKNPLPQGGGGGRKAGTSAIGEKEKRGALPLLSISRAYPQVGESEESAVRPRGRHIGKKKRRRCVRVPCRRGKGKEEGIAS